MKPSAAQIRQMKRDNLQWPVKLADVPRASWPAEVFEDCAPRLQVMRSRTFLVQIFAEDGGMLRLSINRTEWDERQNRFREDIAWDDLQRLKAEAGFGDRLAVETFPPDRLIVNVANMRHLWVMPAGAERLPFVWGGRKASSEKRKFISEREPA